jgi:hypothetical protein
MFGTRALALVIVLAGCGSPRYFYSPPEITSAQVAGTPAVSFALPHGTMRVATLGLTDLSDTRAVHVRILVENRSGDEWSIAGSEQLIDVGSARHARLVPGLDGDRAIVPSGETRSVDVFFVLPPDLASARDLPSFDAIVVVRTREAVVSERAHFERFLAAPPQPPTQ